MQFLVNHTKVSIVSMVRPALFFAVLFDFFFIQYSNIAVPKHFVLVPSHPLNIRLMRTHTYTIFSYIFEHPIFYIVVWR